MRAVEEFIYLESLWSANGYSEKNIRPCYTYGPITQIKTQVQKVLLYGCET